jgi:predicted ATP-grasp superfamily ATP-dependent carboligase
VSMGVRPTILVTDAETRAVVAACRGLAADGFRVAAAAGSHPAPAHWSRACHERLSVPHPVEQHEGFCEALEEAARGGGYAVLLPGGDASLAAISQHRHRLEPHVRLGLPSHDVVLGSLDKVHLAAAATEAGLAPPASVLCTDPEEAAEAGRRLSFPVVLKAAQSVYEARGRRWRVGSVRVQEEAALRTLAAQFGEVCIVQQVEPGAIVSFAGTIGDGRLLGVAASRYLRTWYPEAGNVCFSESIEPPPGLTERVSSLLDEMRWEGIFELELIERPDGSHAAIDLNPRLYGSLALALQAGSNLPALWCRHVLGEQPEPTTARPGVRYRWEDADYRHMLAQLRKGRIRSGLAVLRPYRHVAHPHARLDDPGPLVARALSLVRLAFRRRPERPVTTEPDVRDRRTRGPRRRRNPAAVAVIGAGPYGLAAATHLRALDVPARVFGEPLEFWREQMPEGMILRSRSRSSHIADPHRAFTIDRFAEAEGRKLHSPSLTLEEFVDYGLWFQRNAVPDVDRRKVRQVEQVDGRFRLELEDGEERLVERVAVAAGLFPFAYRPEPFASLPDGLVSHSSDHRDLGVFSDRNVLVVGGGQSALESAALLCEAGANVEVAARAPEIHWLADGGPPRPKTLRDRLPLPLPPTDVGGFSTGWTAATPDFFRRIPGGLKPVVTYRCIRPAGSGWLRPRLEEVPIGLEALAMGAEAANGQVRVTLGDGSERLVDHVLLGTGYAIDVRRYPFLAPELAGSVEVAGGGYPVLRRGLESSVPGLHFLGASAAMTFGPIMRFVVGTWYAAPAFARRAAGRRQPPLRFSF